jgi:hypothetical protein
LDFFPLRVFLTPRRPPRRVRRPPTLLVVEVEGVEGVVGVVSVTGVSGIVVEVVGERESSVTGVSGAALNQFMGFHDK